MCVCARMCVCVRVCVCAWVGGGGGDEWAWQCSFRVQEGRGAHRLNLHSKLCGEGMFTWKNPRARRGAAHGA